MGRRRTHSEEFKREAVRLIRERGVTTAQASRDLGVHPNPLRLWVKAFEADPGDCQESCAGGVLIIRSRTARRT